MEACMRRAAFVVTVLGCGLAACGQSEGGKSSAAGEAKTAPVAAAPVASSETGPIKVGVLHSLSGTMAISETSLKDVALMTIESINKAGGVLGRKLEPVV